MDRELQETRLDLTVAQSELTRLKAELATARETIAKLEADRESLHYKYHYLRGYIGTEEAPV